MYSSVEKMGGNPPVKGKMSAEDLLQLTDDKALGSINTTVIESELVKASAIADGYCGVKYSVPFASVPAVIEALVEDLARAGLFSRRVSELPPAVQKAKDDAIAFLKDVSKGIASLGIDPAPAAPTVGAPESNKTTNDRMFTRDKLSGF